MNLQTRNELDQYLQDILQSTVFDMDISIDYTNRSITASYEPFDFDDDVAPAPTFSKIMLNYITNSEHTAEEICTLALVDFRVISRAQAKPSYKPSKTIVLALGMALKLTEPLMEAFLQSAAYEFTYTTRRDLVLRFFIERQLYDITLINGYLTYYKELILGSV